MTKPEQLDATRPMIKFWALAMENQRRVDEPGSTRFFVIKHTGKELKQTLGPASDDYRIRQEGASFPYVR